MLIKVGGDKTKSLVIEGKDGDTKFSVWGNGVVNANKIYTKGLQVRVDPHSVHWPDYVFKKDYELMPLDKVESFVKQNSHLPAVPSESEIYKKGVDMVEMDAALLRKIEELTLYIIEQNKELKRVNEKVTELEAKLK